MNKNKLLKAIKHFKEEKEILEENIVASEENKCKQSAYILAKENLEMVIQELAEIINIKEEENE